MLNKARKINSCNNSELQVLKGTYWLKLRMDFSCVTNRIYLTNKQIKHKNISISSCSFAQTQLIVLLMVHVVFAGHLNKIGIKSWCFINAKGMMKFVSILVWFDQSSLKVAIFLPKFIRIDLYDINDLIKTLCFKFGRGNAAWNLLILQPSSPISRTIMLWLNSILQIKWSFTTSCHQCHQKSSLVFNWLTRRCRER